LPVAVRHALHHAIDIGVEQLTAALGERQPRWDLCPDGRRGVARGSSCSG